MKVVYKYPLPHILSTVDSETSVSVAMPWGAALLRVERQEQSIVIWAEVDPEVPTEERRFRLLATGQKFSFSGTYVGTFFVGQLVWHLYEDLGQ